MANTRGELVAARIVEVDKNNSYEPKAGGISVSCMFNPFEYSVSKTNTYQPKAGNQSDVPVFEFKEAGPQTLKLNLTFDTYETGKDVSLETNQLWKLMEAKTREESGQNKKVPPPEVAFEWGQAFRFVSVITSMSQKFTLFMRDGTPVRAQVDLTFTQHKDLNDYPKQNPTSGGGPIQQLWRVKAGDRMDLIAYEVYGDPTKWRLIALANGITNPLVIRPGQQLTIPED